MSLEKLIAQATCEGCKNNWPKAKRGGHLFWCGTPGCQPSTNSGHVRSCDSQADNKDLIKALKAYIKERVKRATRKHIAVSK
jgi:hypothetical protein